MSTITVPLVDLVVSVYSVLLETHHLTSDIQRRANIVVLYKIYSKKLVTEYFLHVSVCIMLSVLAI